MMPPVDKKPDVPLEEALNIAGGGLYTYCAVITSGLIAFSGLLCVQGMAFVMPVAGCELHLSNTTRGVFSSMTFTGMLFSAQVFGFLADAIGRKRVMMFTQAVTFILVVLWSLAPNTITLGVVLFLNGLILPGTFTSVYVYVGEFSSSKMRAKVLLGMSAIVAMANVHLPFMAWIILPLDVSIPIFGQLVFTSWRLYILSISVPILLSLLFLSKLPETPKFLLSQGKQEETLEVLKKMYAVNQRKSKEEFPVSNLILDVGEEVSSKQGRDGDQFISYFRLMIKQTARLFSKQYLLYTLISCALLFGVTGICNTMVLWFPEITSRIRSYSQTQEVFNVTLCDVMRDSDAGVETNCNLDYNFLSAGVLLGAVEVIACIVVGLFSSRMNKKMVTSFATFLTAGACFSTAFVTSESIIVVSLAAIIVVLFVAFPILISKIVELFPTHLRSSAASITMTSARLGSAVGGQIMGVLYGHHCTEGYFGLTAILIASGILCILIPKKKSPS